MSKLTWNDHVDHIVRKASKRLYMLYQLKRAGIAQHDLVRVYVSVIRPVLEYACPVWHTGFPNYLTQSIAYEKWSKKRALQCVYPGQSYSAILVQTKFPTLHERRDELCRSYFTRMKREGHKLNHLLPAARDQQYSLRHDRPYPSIKTRTDRFHNALIPWGLHNCQ